MKRILSILLIAAMLLTFAACVPDGKENATTEPAATDTQATEPEATDTQATDTQATDTQATEPEATEPEATEPEGTEPEGTEPEGTEPEGTDTQGTEPEGTKPEGTEPEGTEPEGTAPEGTDPEGGDEIITPAPGMSEEEWISLFAFENVQIDSYMGDDLMSTALVDGEIVAVESYDTSEYGTRENLPMVDFSGYFSAFTEMSEGVFVALNVPFEGELDLELALTFSSVSIGIEDGVITKVAYTMDLGMGMTMSFTHTFSRYGEIAFDLTEEEIAAILAIGELNAFFASDAFENYSAEATFTDASGRVVKENVHIDGALVDGISQAIKDGEVLYEVSMNFAVYMAGYDCMEDAAGILYMTLTHDMLTYDSESGRFLVTEPIEFYPTGAEYAIASNVSFAMEEGLLREISYDTESYIYDEGKDEIVVYESSHTDMIFSGYGENTLASEPLAEEAWTQVSELLNGDSKKMINLYLSEFVGFDGEAQYANTELAVQTHGDGTFDLSLNVDGELTDLENVTEAPDETALLDAFTELWNSMDASAFVSRDASGTFYCTGEAVYMDWYWADLFSFSFEDGVLGVSMNGDDFFFSMTVEPIAE